MCSTQSCYTSPHLAVALSFLVLFFSREVKGRSLDFVCNIVQLRKLSFKVYT